jgi:hypothetical protein
MLRAVDDDTGKTQSNKDVVEALEDSLARAKKGEIDQVAIAWVEPDGGVNFRYSSAPHSQPAGLIGVIHVMVQDLGDRVRGRGGLR